MYSSDSVPPVLQLVGLGDGPIILAPSQLHGNRTLLLTNPESVRIDIHPIKRPLSSSMASTGAPNLVWRQHGGKQIPEHDMPSPTIFQNRVFEKLQHALLAFLLWSRGGVSGNIQWTPYPCGVTGFPHFLLANGTQLGFCDNECNETTKKEVGHVALHFLQSEPGTGLDVLASSPPDSDQIVWWFMLSNW